MKIHEFLAAHRDEVREACVRNLKRTSRARPDDEIAEDFRVFIEQVIQRLRHSEGLPEERSLPGLRETAARVGHAVHERGLDIENAARSFASLSVSLGEVGERYHLAFDAGEYRNFNEAIDDSVAIAIEQFTKDVRDEHRLATSEQVGFLAHELRTAVCSAQLAFTVLERGGVGVCGPTAGVVRRSLRRMDHLIERTLADLRLSAGLPLQLRPLLVTPVLRDLEADAVLERQIRIQVDTDESLAALADDQLLAVILGNLVQNAIKCSRDGAVVEVRALREPDAVVVEVEDECGGLQVTSPEELFEPFVRKRSDRRGLGLGLAITRRAADALSAAIAVRDLPGKGCIFALRLRPVEGALESFESLRCATPTPLKSPATRS